MQHPLNEISAQLNRTAALIDPERLAAFMASMVGTGAQAQNSNQADKPKLSAEAYAISTGWTGDSKYRPYKLVEGIAVIAVTGVLLHRHDWSSNYATGYPVIQRKLAHARADPAVKGIFLDFNTFGGTVAGCADTADLIHEIGKEKPIAGHANDYALSAGLWLFSQCTHRYLTQSAKVGSLGCVVMHLSMEKALENYGYKATMIHSGKHKVDGNPYQDLSPDVLARIQSEVDEVRAEFAAAVARGTGLSDQAALDTEASSYKGKKAVEIGFAQQIISGTKAITQFSKTINPTASLIMPDPNADSSQVPTPGADANQVPAPVATTNPAPTAAPTAAEERTRIGAILQCEEAEGRSALANHLAFSTDMSADAAKAALAAAPKAAAAAAEPPTPQSRDKSLLEQALAGDDVPEIGAGADDELEESADENSASAILNSTLAYMGIKAK